MTLTPNLALDPLVSAQAQKHITVNEAFARLDAATQLAVLDRDLADPPASPTDGARYLLPPSPTGAWSGRGGDVAAWDGAALGWLFLTPRVGWRLWLIDEDALLVLTDAGWQETGGGSASLNPATGDLLGVNATADPVNRLSVKSEAALFSHEDAPGSGDMRLTLNKAAPADDTSLTLQSGFEARAQIGLTGDDDLHLKVSPDGIAFHEAMIVDRTSGEIDPVGGIRRTSTFVDVTRFTVGSTFDDQFHTYVCDVGEVNPAGHYDTATGIYTVPEDGLYAISATMRCLDGSPAGTQFGFGVHTQTIGNPWIQWCTVQTALRSTFNYQRIMACTLGDPLRMLVYGSDPAIDLFRATLQIYKISN